MSTSVERTQESVSDETRNGSMWDRQVVTKCEQRRAWGKTLKPRYRENEITHRDGEHCVGEFTRKGTGRDADRVSARLATGWNSPRKFNGIDVVTSSPPTVELNPKCRKARGKKNNGWPQKNKGDVLRTFESARRQPQGDKGDVLGAVPSYWTSGITLKWQPQVHKAPLQFLFVEVNMRRSRWSEIQRTAGRGRWTKYLNLKTSRELG